MSVEEAINSELFEKDARDLYESKTQEALIEGKWFTLVDALDDTVDMWHYGKGKWNIPVHNTYIPVKHTIMPKPKLLESYNDDIGFRFGQTFDKLAINPVQQINPLKGFRMGPPVERKADAKEPGGKKWPHLRRLSHVHRRFSTTITRSSVENVDAVRKYFNNM